MPPRNIAELAAALADQVAKALAQDLDRYTLTGKPETAKEKLFQIGVRIIGAQLDPTPKWNRERVEYDIGASFKAPAPEIDPPNVITLTKDQNGEYK